MESRTILAKLQEGPNRTLLEVSSGEETALALTSNYAFLTS